MNDAQKTTDQHPWYDPCDALGQDNTCVECFNQATLEEVYKLVVWGTHYEAVPFGDATASLQASSADYDGADLSDTGGSAWTISPLH